LDDGAKMNTMLIKETTEFELGHLDGFENLPLVVSPKNKLRLAVASAQLRELIETHLLNCGGMLFRGFDVANVDEFQQFAAGFGHPLLSYEFASTPRTQVAEGIYTSTEYPPHQAIPLHNEQSYTRDWPMKIWFYCAVAAQSGGATPIADSRKIYRAIAPEIRDRFAGRGLMYVRNYGSGLDVPWTQVFNTHDRAAVEQYCRMHDIVCEWKADGELRTRQRCQAVARHPRTQEMVWFNQAHLFHISALEPAVRETLLDVVTEEDLPRNVYYGDGKPIEEALLDEIRGVLDDHKVTFPWQQGDVLMLDNMLTAHAREPFKGPRRVVVAMAEGHRA
jgi:alpha-ketoglutarate-dependent taurine dioxygenase